MHMTSVNTIVFITFKCKILKTSLTFDLTIASVFMETKLMFIDYYYTHCKLFFLFLCCYFLQIMSFT